jgi:hypothetical protein
LLIPLDGTFSTRHEAIPVAIQKIEEKPSQSDLMQRWESGPGYIFLESRDEQEVLATYPKDREAEGVKIGSHLFPKRPRRGMPTTNHIIIELPGFSGGVAAFTNRCEQAQ